MAIQFPDSPIEGDQFTASNGVIYTYENGGWNGNSASGLEDVFVNISGDEMSGNLTVPSLNGGPLGGFRNFITNGDMAIDQRYNGTLTTVKSTNEYILDHWRGLGGSNGGSNSAELGQVTTTFPQRNVFRYSMQISHVNGASYTGDVGCVQGIEEQFAAGQVLTVSCYATEAPANLEFFLSSNTLTSRVVQYSGTMTDLSGVDDANGFRYYSATFELISTNSIGNIGGVEFKWTGGATRYMTGVQVERSPVATPFEHRPIGTELALCQRYYQTVDNYALTGVTRLAGTTGTIYASGSLQTTMRVSPTGTRTTNMSRWNTGSDVIEQQTIVDNAIYTSPAAVRIYFKGSWDVALKIGYAQTGGSPGIMATFDAEL